MSRSFTPGWRSAGSATRRNAEPVTAKPLPTSQRSFFESAFGQDFSQVRVHTDTSAQNLADAMDAKAVTQGEDISFARGRFAPESGAGRALLAHELAHVTQQRQGGGAPAAAEARARGAAQSVASGATVDAASLGGVDPGLHCEPNDAEKKPEGSVLPPMPNLQLQTLPPIDWLKMRQAYDLRGSSMSLRDADSLGKEWERSSRLLDTLGINDNFKLGFITKEWILNKGLSLQLDDRLSRENPNYFDRQNLDWKQSHPGSWQTPTIPIFDLDWFRSSKKKK